MNNIIQTLQKLLTRIFRFFVPERITAPVTQEIKSTLGTDVVFYRSLSIEEQSLFDKRVMLFLSTTEIVGVDIDVNDADKALVAASAIIPVWAFKNWHYLNLRTVILYPHSFNESFEYKKSDSNITGMVGSGRMHGTMILSKPALHLGFKNTRDKQNVGVHEFVHLIDMMDGSCDGFPERLAEYAYSIPWLNLVENKIQQIDNKESNIRQYGATNKQEFFAVASEYFFERPKMLKAKHPELYQSLQKLYQQDVAEIQLDVSTRKKDPCPCGSGKRYKRCCLPKQ